VNDLLLHDIPVVASATPLSVADIEGIELFQQRRPRQSLIVIADADLGILRSLLRTGGKLEVLWRSEAPTALAPAIRRAYRSSFFTTLAQIIQCAAHLDARVRWTLSQAVLLSSPVKSVSALAAIGGITPDVLWRRWRESTRAAEAARLEDVIDWLILLRSVQRRELAGSWQRVADAVGVSPRTLTRHARRLARSTLKDIEITGFEHLATCCRSAFSSWLEPITRTSTRHERSLLHDFP
jgi:hypothetical protein